MCHEGLRVVQPGMYATVQDLGRSGWTNIGLPAGGAADARSLVIGNRLIGNTDHHAAIEMTLIGGEYEFLADGDIVLAGAPCTAAVIHNEGHSIAVSRYEPIEVLRGHHLRIGRFDRGAHAYLCVRGGIAVEPVLGSLSTYAPAALGGYEGRALRAGDVLRVGDAAPAPSRRISSALRTLLDRQFDFTPLRVTRGPHLQFLGLAAVTALLAGDFRVAARSGRMGIRLTHTPILTPVGGRLITEGMFHGAIQLPPSGEPIILGVDHPTTGGYPIIAAVIRADLHRVGQLRPGDRVRFAEVSFNAARALAREEQATVNALCPAHFTDTKTSEK